MITLDHPVATLVDQDGELRESVNCYEVKEGDPEYPFVLWFKFPVVIGRRTGFIVHLEINGLSESMHAFPGLSPEGDGGWWHVSLPIQMIGPCS
jgi:hypothetical protein